MNEIDLTNSDLYINRELSLLEFNRRVFAQAKDESLPLLERLKFLCITSSNLDEFFEIRVSGIKQQVAYAAIQSGPDKLSPIEQLKQISNATHELVEEQYKILNEALLPELEKKGIRFLRRNVWDEKIANWIRRFFNHELLPVLSPIGLDPAHPFPKILNKSLNFIVSLEGKDAFGRNSGIAIVQAPRSLTRLIQLPEDVSGSEHDFVFLSSIIHAHVSDLFPSMQVNGCYQFRVTRNGDLMIDDDDDLKMALEGRLDSRRFSDAVRLEVADDCPPEMSRFLLHQFKLSEDDMYQVNGPVNLNRLMALFGMIDRVDLKSPEFVPKLPKRINKNTNYFELIQEGDLLLNHPFESFTPVVDFVRQASIDPDVLAIKQTLYRAGSDSVIVKALVGAAKAGKEVTVVIELRARFDEEANIELANLLQEAGAHVVYGVVGYKTHAKMLLVVRRESRKLRRYVHLSTGNYHASTARLYTDYGLLTCDPDIGEDVHKIFHQLTALGRSGKLKKLLQSPFTLHKTMLAYIQREIDFAQQGQPARIIAKMNSLYEAEIIQALYKASQAGVKIDLIVRGVCALRPGVKGISDNISVRSIIGEFLEHTRIFYFQNNDDPQVYCSSADWMARNFFHRVESCFPIEDEALKKRVIKQGLMVYLSDNTGSWLLQRDGSYKRNTPGRNTPKSAQKYLLEEI